MKILITAFEPFGGDSVNASLEAMRRLKAPQGVKLIRLEVPTVFGLAGQCVAGALEEQRPDWVICLGQAAGRSAVTPERVAINIRDASIPDNAQQQPVDEPVVPHGPAALFSTLPIRKMVAAAKENGYSAAISNTAGTFVCNDLMYSLLYTLQSYNTIRGGFVHVPALPDSRKPAAGMPLDEIVGALEAMLCSLQEEERCD